MFNEKFMDLYDVYKETDIVYAIEGQKEVYFTVDVTLGQVMQMLADHLGEDSADFVYIKTKVDEARDEQVNGQNAKRAREKLNLGPLGVTGIAQAALRDALKKLDIDMKIVIEDYENLDELEVHDEVNSVTDLDEWSLEDVG